VLNNNISKLTLGTVQFGMPYGIANKTGCPSYNEVREIMRTAWENGVSSLDTAATYGSSEEVLGKVMKDLNISKKMCITTKIIHMQSGLSKSEAAQVIEKSITNSLSLLGVEKLEYCVFHDENNFIYYDLLLPWKEKGCVARTGVSVSTPDAALKIAGTGTVDYLQIPVNVLDSRFLQHAISKTPNQNKPVLFARSVYLQGLLLMPAGEIPAGASDAIPVITQLIKIAGLHGMTMQELCLRYVLSIKEIHSVIIGVDTRMQLLDNLTLFSRGPLDENLFKEIKSIIPILPEKCLTPGSWNS